MFVVHQTSHLAARSPYKNRKKCLFPSLLQTFWGQVFLPRRQEGRRVAFFLLPCCQIRTLDGSIPPIFLGSNDFPRHYFCPNMSSDSNGKRDKSFPMLQLHCTPQVRSFLTPGKISSTKIYLRALLRGVYSYQKNIQEP